jgi:hypothetical protein
MTALVVATMPDRLIGALSERMVRVDVFDLARGLPRSDAQARLYWSDGGYYARDRLHALQPGTQLQTASYDAVLFPHGSLFGEAAIGALALLAEAERVVKPGGIVAFKAEVAAGLAPHPSFFDASLVSDDGLPLLLDKHTGLIVEGGFDARLSRATASRVWPEATGRISGQPYFLTRDNGRILVPSLWFLRKRGAPVEGGWQRVRDVLIDRRLGEQIGELLTGPAGQRREDGGIGVLPEAKGHVFYGPYLPVSGGSYNLEIVFDASGKSGRNDIVIDIVVSGDVLLIQEVPLDQRPTQRFDIRFTIPSVPFGQPVPRIEIRATCSHIEGIFRQCRLSRIQD